MPSTECLRSPLPARNEVASFPVMDREATGRRIKAARQLISLTVPELAARMDLPGLGAKTLGNIERGDRELRPQEIASLASALEVPEAFLTGEKPAGESQLDVIEQLLRDDVEERRQQRDEIIARLDRLEAALKSAVSETVAAETDNLRRVVRDLASGRPPKAPSTSPRAPQLQPGAKRKRATQPRIPARP